MRLTLPAALLALAPLAAFAQDRLRADDCSVANRGNGNDVTLICGDQTIVVGFTPEQFEDALRRRTEELREQVKALQSAVLVVPDLHEELELKKSALSDAETRLDDVDGAYREAVALNEDLRREIERLRGADPGGLTKARFDEALTALVQNRRDVADALLAELQKSEADQEAIARQARVAYERGRIAEGDSDYPKAVEQYARAAQLAPEDQRYLLKAHEYSWLAGRYDVAAQIGRDLVSLAREGAGDEPTRDLSVALSKLAFAYISQGRYREAASLAERSLDVGQAVYGVRSYDVATLRVDLARIYMLLGRFAEAEPLFTQAIELQEASSYESRDLGLWLLGLADLYLAQARYSEAEPLLLRSAGILEEMRGPEHRELAIVLNSLAVVYYFQGRLGEAEPLYERVLRIFEGELGPDHPELVLPLQNIATLYRDQDRYEDAERHYLRALDIASARLGQQHMFFGRTLSNMGELYRREGRYEEAEPLMERSIAIIEASVGRDHPWFSRARDFYLALLDEIPATPARDARVAELTRAQ